MYKRASSIVLYQNWIRLRKPIGQVVKRKVVRSISMKQVKRSGRPMTSWLDLLSGKQGKLLWSIFEEQQVSLKTPLSRHTSKGISKRPFLNLSKLPFVFLFFTKAFSPLYAAQAPEKVYIDESCTYLMSAYNDEQSFSTLSSRPSDFPTYTRFSVTI